MRLREDEAAWASTEFGQAEVGDQRRTTRLVQVATALGDQPRAALPAAGAAPAPRKAADRCFDTDALTPDAILVSHVPATYPRLRAVPLVLAVTDTPFLDWPRPPGAGPPAGAGAAQYADLHAGAGAGGPAGRALLGTGGGHRRPPA